jgi:hypothetical protein
MNIITQSDVFFFISSVGFVSLWVLLAIFLIYLIKISRKFSRIIDKVEQDIGDISDTTKDMFLDIRESAFFNFLFGAKKRGRKENKKNN